MTPYQRHVAAWNDCRRCPLCKGRRRVVHARGSVPADVLFVGEAPGQSEDVLGLPFVGPAGKLLDEIVAKAMPDKWIDDATNPQAEMAAVVDGYPPRYKCAWFNLVGCFPKEQKAEGVNEPPPEAIKACTPRLVEFVLLCRPRLIVMVGGLSQKWVPKLIAPDSLTAASVNIVHPAAILRAPSAQQGMMVQRAVVTLASALEDLG